MLLIGIVGAVIWGLAYAALSGFLDQAALTRLFLFGAVSIPVSHLLERVALTVLDARKPVAPEVKGDRRGTAGIRSGAQERADTADAKEHVLYFRDLKVWAVIRLAFVVLLYQLVAKQTPQPVMVLIVGSVIFALAIPKHLVLHYRRREEPALYKTFIFSNGSLAHRCGTLAAAIAVQLGLMVLV